MPRRRWIIIRKPMAKDWRVGEHWAGANDNEPVAAEQATLAQEIEDVIPW